MSKSCFCTVRLPTVIIPFDDLAVWSILATKMNVADTEATCLCRNMFVTSYMLLHAAVGRDCNQSWTLWASRPAENVQYSITVASTTCDAPNWYNLVLRWAHHGQPLASQGLLDHAFELLYAGVLDLIVYIHDTFIRLQKMKWFKVVIIM